jgi:hypothetical protein
MLRLSTTDELSALVGSNELRVDDSVDVVSTVA